MNHKIRSLCFAIFLVSTQTGCGGPTSSKFRCNLRNNGLAPITHINHNQPSVVWNFPKVGTIGQIDSTPAVGQDGTIYFGSYDQTLYALYPSGDERWEHKFGVEVHSSPAVGSNGLIYIGTHGQGFFALNASDGSTKWAVLGGQVVDSSPAVDGDYVYVGGSNTIHAFNADTGAFEWLATTRGPIISSPAVAPDGTVYVQSEDGNLYAFDSGPGNNQRIPKWSYLTKGFDSSPAIGVDGTVYVIDKFGLTLFAIAPNGAPVGKTSLADSCGNRNSFQPVYASPAVIFEGGNDEMIYVGNSRCFEALNVKGLAYLWAQPHNGGFSSPVVVRKDDILLVGGDTRLIAAYTSAPGRKIWDINTMGTVTSSPAVGPDRTIYIGGGDHRLYAIR